MIRAFNFTFSLLLLTSVLLSGCASQSKELTGQQLGVLLGAIIGVALGNNNSSDFAGALIGGAIGGAIGSNIGRDLDVADRAKAEETKLMALRDQKAVTVAWRSDNNPSISGVITTEIEPQPSGPVTSTSKNSSVPSIVQSAATPSRAADVASPLCKKVTHLISVNGQERREETRMCQRPGGSWFLA
jgi:surface antigen